jgi:hypothetical protein
MSRVIKFAGFLGFLSILIACNSSGKNLHEGQMNLNDGRSFNYTLEIPTAWNGQYEVQQTGSRVTFDYKAEPQTTIFTLTALTEAEWAGIQNDPGVLPIIFQDGAMFVYTIALENLYSGSQADEFQQMAADVQGIIASLNVTAIQ